MNFIKVVPEKYEAIFKRYMTIVATISMCMKIDNNLSKIDGIENFKQRCFNGKNSFADMLARLMLDFYDLHDEDVCSTILPCL